MSRRLKLKDLMWRPLFRAQVPMSANVGELVEYAGRYFVLNQERNEYREVRPYRVLNVEDDYLP
jgi:hypothetical protein